MKRIFLLLCAYIGMLSALTAQVSAPKSFTCRSMAWSLTGQVLANDTISVQLSVLKGSVTGPRVYREFHTTTTDSSGIFTLEVGQGNSPLGLFYNINWFSDIYFLNIAIDSTGGKKFQTIATTQIMIVSLSAPEKKEDTIQEVEEVFTHFLGESFGGGLIFSIYKDTAGTEHGLIVSPADVSPGVEWSNISGRLVGTNQKRVEGDSNTVAIIAQEGHMNSAAKLCREYTNGGFTDWYLPGIDELKSLWAAHVKIQKKKEKDSTYAGPDLVLQPVKYWSSTEYNADEARFIDLSKGETGNNYKYNKNFVLAVRRF